MDASGEKFGYYITADECSIQPTLNTFALVSEKAYLPNSLKAEKLP